MLDRFSIVDNLESHIFESGLAFKSAGECNFIDGGPLRIFTFLLM
jgi:hypothetical protein